MTCYSDWTLFLDRDGVINRRIKGDYIRQFDSFEFLEGVLPAIETCTSIFSRIIIVTNQQGVGKEVMTVDDLQNIHNLMINTIQKAGGRIDAVYFAPELSSQRSFLRKPNIGMGMKAKKQFPELNFRNSIMVGDSFTDMQFGKRLGMTTVLVGEDTHLAKENPKHIDFYFPSLYDFSVFLTNSQ